MEESDPQAASRIVDSVLHAARVARASDVHLVPGPEGLAMHWRIDGVLQLASTFGPELAPRLTNRLKVLARLLTYQTDVPQEGRIVAAGETLEHETRVSSFPTIYGEKLVIRLFQQPARHRLLADLGLPADIERDCRELLDRTSGLLLVAGPAGSGKTTTVYAALRELVEHTAGTRSLVSLEDPVEVEVPGVAQSQVNLAAGFDLPTGLRSLMRQDPEVICVGEIRDVATAQVAVQAALTGHLVLSTFHSYSAYGALQRLLDMGIEPYLLRGLIRGVLAQRLVRRLCPCGVATAEPADLLGWPVPTARRPVGCPDCFGTGYRGRFPLAELLGEGELLQISQRPGHLMERDAREWEQSALERGWPGFIARACAALAEGVTSAAELRRTLGFDNPFASCSAGSPRPTTRHETK